MKQPKKIPDNTDELLKVFQGLCEKYADEADTPHHRNSKGPAEIDLLNFCHAYAYKLNGVEPW